LIINFIYDEHRRCLPVPPLRYAFDLLDRTAGTCLGIPIEVRKATLASILRKSRHGVRL
jgi:hypothetical protein